jgi:hypothetical protein
MDACTAAINANDPFFSQIHATVQTEEELMQQDDCLINHVFVRPRQAEWNVRYW